MHSLPSAPSSHQLPRNPFDPPHSTTTRRQEHGSQSCVATVPTHFPALTLQTGNGPATGIQPDGVAIRHSGIPAQHDPPQQQSLAFVVTVTVPQEAI